MSHFRPAVRRSGFTLVELLVVIAIIGTLVALLLPAVQAAREAARRNSCQSNLKQIGLALQTHHDSKKSYPAGRQRTDQFGVSWAFELLPFLEQSGVHAAFQQGTQVFLAANAAAMRSPVAVFACPSRRSATADRDFDNNDTPVAAEGRGVGALGDYKACAGKDYRNGMVILPTGDGTTRVDQRPDLAESGAIFSFSKTKEQYVTDGLSNTLVVGDKHLPQIDEPQNPEMLHYEQGDTAFFAGDAPHTLFAETAGGMATSPTDASYVKFGGEHPEIAQFVFLDGHVKAIKKSLEASVLTLLGAIGDEQIVPDGAVE